MTNVKHSRIFIHLSILIMLLIVFYGCSSDSPTSGGDDPATINITIGDVSLAEGNSGTGNLVFTVTISSQPVSGSNVTVDWATTDGIATTTDNDYESDSGTLTFVNGGSLTQQIAVVINGDATVETDETFVVNLSNAVNATITDAQATGTITNDDSETITITIGDASSTEGDAGTSNLDFTVTISGEPTVGNNVTVDWTTADGTATVADNDYTTNSGTLTFINGNPLTQSVTVVIYGDEDVESNETFVVNLTNAVNASIGDAQATGTITNDDTAQIGDLLVDPTSTGTEDGLTWATAYHTIQEAIDSSYSAGGGEIWVAANTYTSGDADPTVPVVSMKLNVHIFGGFEGYNSGSGAMETARAQRDYDNNTTILDGEDITDHVVFIQGASNTIVDGFTITGGNADGDFGGGMHITSLSATVANCIFTENNAARGAAIYFTDRSPEISDCQFTDNNATFGGGAIWMYRSSPNITDCQFTGNNASQFGGALYISDDAVPDTEPILLNCTFVSDSAFGNSGGGIYCENSSPSLTDCSFTNCYSSQNGGGIRFDDCSPTLTNCSFTGNTGGIEGGGMYNYTASPTMTNCDFTDNTASKGGGMYNYTNSLPVMTGCDFTGNSSTTTNVNGGGGGVSNSINGSPTMTNCTFNSNTAVKQGGGMYSYSSTPTLIECVFTENEASDMGGGVHNDWYSWAIIKDCRFSENVATNGGGGVCNYRYCSPQISGCIFVDNHADYGGGIFNDDNCDPVLANSVFTLNYAVSQGGAIRNEDGSPKLINCILYGDLTDGVDAEVSNDVYSTPLYSFCSIDIDPLWVNAALNNFRLQTGSPCIDAGNNIDIYDLDNDSDITELIPISLDYYGNTRFSDDGSTTDTGNGTAPIIDIGVFEF